MTSSMHCGFRIFCKSLAVLPHLHTDAHFSMKRVESGGKWSLFCPNEASGLHEVWGDEFEALYEQYEREGRARKTVEAQKLWYAMLEAQIETGGPFMLYKDAANSK